MRTIKSARCKTKLLTLYVTSVVYCYMDRFQEIVRKTFSPDVRDSGGTA